jgi:PIN domain nuclease of toxin-antitoxin system
VAVKLLIDSHVLLWAAIDDPRLAGAQREAYIDPENDLLVSTATLWELGIKYALGKLPLPVAPRDFFAREIAVRGYVVLDVKRAHAERAAELPYPDPRHRDPFDRMLISQALVEGIAMLSADHRVEAYRPLGLRLVS